MFGAFAAVCLAVVLVVSCGILVDSSLQAPIPVERLSAAEVVVQADPTFGADGNVSAALSERRRLPARARGAPADVPGVRAAVADRSFPRRSSTRAGTPHGTRRSGRRRPRLGQRRAHAARARRAAARRARPREIVRHRRARRSAARSSRRPPSRRDRHDAGELHRRRHRRRAAAPRLTREAPIFFRGDVARRLSGTGDRADLIGVVARPGADAQRRRDSACATCSRSPACAC